MSGNNFQIALLYNEEKRLARGEPQDLTAIQYTVTTTQHLYDTLTGLGYPTIKIAVRTSLDKLEDTLCSFSPKDTFIFNNCDGFTGSNLGAVLVIRLIERLGFKHTGAPADAIELCIDKPRAKERLLQFGIPTPCFQVFERPDGDFHLRFPVIVKPSVEDGSMGINLNSVVCNLESLFSKVAYILDRYQQPVVVEEFIPGRELAVAMCGNETVEILPIAEEDYSLIADPLQRLLTYEAKWDSQSSYYHNIISRIPAPLTPKEEQIVRQTAEASFRAMGLYDLGRVDLRFYNKIPYVIDINELPDLSPESGYWKSARAAGLSYPEMVERILDYALKREGWRP